MELSNHIELNGVSFFRRTNIQIYTEAALPISNINEFGLKVWY